MRKKVKIRTKNSGKTAAWNQSSRASAVSLVVKNEANGIYHLSDQLTG